MRITIATGGSRGDVQPYVALGVALRERGHAVRVLSYRRYAGIARERGLDFAELSGDPEEIVAGLVAAGSNPLTFARRFRELTAPAAEVNMRETLEACREADTVVYANVTFMGYMAAERFGIPAVAAGLQPTFDGTGVFPSFRA